MWPVDEVVGEHDSLADAIGPLKENALATVPIRRDDGRLEGTLVLRDAIAAVEEGRAGATVGSVARAGATVAADAELEAALKVLQAQRVNRLPVTEAETIVGMVSQGDIHAVAALEELGVPVARVSRTISAHDKMFEKAAAAYLYAGAVAMQLIRQCLTAVGTPEVRRVLDFGCGHGRVMRVLRAAFPDGELVACDIDKDAVSFCAETFGARPVLASKEATSLSLEGTYDLIWSGSVLTHLDPLRWAPLLSMLAGRLAPGGAVVVTVNGAPMTQVWQTARWSYSLPADELAKLVDAYRKQGTGYRNYPDREDYGLSVCSPEKFAEIAGTAGLRVVAHLEGAWAPRQGTVGHDVVALAPRR